MVHTKSVLQTREPEDAATAYLRSLPELKRYIANILPHLTCTGEIEDIAQEVFIRAYEAKKRQKLEYGRAFLFRIARNLSLNIHRKRRNSLEEAVEEFVLEGVIDNVPLHEEQLFQKQRLKALTDAISELTPKCREAFLLRHFEGLSYKEIAVRMSITVSAVEKHLSKALMISTRAVSKFEDDMVGVRNAANNDRAST